MEFTESVSTILLLKSMPEAEGGTATNRVLGGWLQAINRSRINNKPDTFCMSLILATIL
jgi:hypothetical protein